MHCELIMSRGFARRMKSKVARGLAHALRGFGQRGGKRTGSQIVNTRVTDNHRATLGKAVAASASERAAEKF